MEINPNPPFYILLNVRSGKNNTQDDKAVIEKILSEANRAYEIILIDKPDNLVPIAKKTIETAKKQNGIVVIGGGDGAISSVAQLAWSEDCPLGLLPQGTFNYFCRTHHVPENTEDAVRLLTQGQIKPVEVGQVNGRLFLVNASLGLYPDLLEKRESVKQQFGRNRPVALIAGFFFLLREHRLMKIRLESGNDAAEFKTSTLFVGNNELQLQQVGILDGETRGKPGLLAVMLKPAGKWTMFRLMLRGALGTLREEENVASLFFTRMKVTRLALFSHKVKAAIDGEVQWLENPLEFQLAPRPLRIIAPQSPDNSDSSQ